MSKSTKEHSLKEGKDKAEVVAVATTTLGCINRLLLALPSSASETLLK